MNYLARLKDVILENQAPNEPSKLPKGAFDSFGSTQVSPFYVPDRPENNLRHGRDAEEESIIGWLASIGEADQTIIGEVLQKCRHSGDARDYFMARAAEEAGVEGITDDRRCCTLCENLTPKGRCLAAWRGELTATARHYSPLPAVPRRCERYAPKPGDPDPRPGRDRWPGLGGAQMESRYDA